MNIRLILHVCPTSAVDSDKEEQFRRNRRCAYEDRDFEEDLSLHDLKRQLAKFEKLSRSSSVNEAENPVAEIKLGDVGYTFEKEFSVGWFHGEVVEILEEGKNCNAHLVWEGLRSN